MSTVCIVLGQDCYKPSEVPDECTVGRWKYLLGEGFLDKSKILYAEKLRCQIEGGITLDDSTPLPKDRMYVQGPGCVITMLELALRNVVGPPVKQIEQPPEDIVVLSSPKASWGRTLVFLHGFNGSGEGFRYHRMFQTPICRCLRVVLPTARILPITAYKFGSHCSWYDYLTDRNGSAEDDLAEVSLEETRRRITALVDAEAKLLGGHYKVFLGGSSQGCGAAFDVFARHGQRLGGFVGLVGHPLSITPVVESAQREVPCYFFNGSADPYMRIDWVRLALERLSQTAGWSHVRTVEAAGVKHDLGEDLESEWLAEFLGSFACLRRWAAGSA